VRDDFLLTVYIMANRRQGAIYTGVTSNLMQRLHQHREGSFEGFSRDNNTKILVWFEQQGTMELAIVREKRIKNWNRQWKISMIEGANPDWKDLAVDLGFPPLQRK
jgi:putative endonuclease